MIRRNGWRDGLAGLTAIGAGILWATTALADPAWVQIEAKPTLPQAEARAQSWSTSFPAGTTPGIEGFALPSGWFAIALGPYESPEDAQASLATLKASGTIPRDSYIVGAGRYGTQFWPEPSPAPSPGTSPGTSPVTAAPDTGADTGTGAAASAQTPLTQGTPTNLPQTEPAQTGLPQESLAQSVARETRLDREGRMRIQSALGWLGYYEGTVDGAFGPATRAAISRWQMAQNTPATGVLSTTAQAQLLASVAADRALLGLGTVEEPQAGIRIDLPVSLTEFDRYDPPFVRYRAKNGSGVSVALISMRGDREALQGLYQMLRSQDFIPPGGTQDLGRSGFVLSGQNETIHSYTQAVLADGAIKGFVAIWPSEKDASMERVLTAMKGSFASLGPVTLDPGLGQPLAVPRAALTAGIGGDRPALSRSGLFIDDTGATLTAAADLQSCRRIAIEGAPAHLAFADTASGLAILQPDHPLAPQAVARLAPSDPQPGAEVVIAGFPYPEAISAPVVNFGTLSALEGLNSDPTRARLAVAARAGDAGGPVLDSAGAVVAMVLPAPDPSATALPGDLAQALRLGPQAATLAAQGLSPKLAPPRAPGASPLVDADLARRARAITTRVDCWR